MNVGPTKTRLILRTYNRGPGCWEWQGYRSEKGYGSLGNTITHRFMYEAFVGPLGPDEVVRHTCDNPVCGRPSHLLKGTQRHTRRQRSRPAEAGPTSEGPSERAGQAKPGNRKGHSALAQTTATWG